MAVPGLVEILGLSARRPRRCGASCLSPCTRRPPIFPAILLLLVFLNASLFSAMAQAQQDKPGVAGLGDLVVTGFSGALPPPPNPPLPPGVNTLDETFIDPNGASLKIFDVTSPGAPPQAQLLNVPTKFQAFARDIGQVFGLALDTSRPANIFAASTSVHGLQIVVPDADGDGRPERIKLGQPGAQWMDGQFGQARGGGPGTVWKIDGETGEITKFADILSGGVPNSGPGLGNIAFDAAHEQLFVSDLDSGLIHRLDMTGADLGAYDHGLQGRPADGLNAVPEDPANRLDITSPAFDAEDPGSWGMAAPERRVWGLALHANRLYYAVHDGPQIWSLGINEDGSFGSDPRWELDVPADPKAYPVSDIAFQSNGRMLLAQRGGIASRYDYSQYHTPRKTRILRYRLEAPDDPATPSRWVAEPEDYAIGFPGIHRNTSGGIAIGYGYAKKADGSYGFGSCEGTLWSTGDALRDNPVHGAKLAQGGPLNVHGLQGNALGLVQPQNAPPWESYFVDYDGQFDDPQASGHVGDVEIARECRRERVMDLRIHKRAIPERCTIGVQCTFEIEISNTGSKTYSGPLVIHDVAHGDAQLLSYGPVRWACSEAFQGSGIYECRNPGVTLKPGEHTSLELIFHMPHWWTRPVYNNCADLLVPGAGIDQRPYNNRSCDYVPTIEHGHPLYAPDLQLEKFGLFGACDFFGLCEFVVRITNVGAAPYTGLLHVNDFTTTPGATLTDWSPKPPGGWNCAALGPDKYGCSTTGPVTLFPGDFREIILLVKGPPIAPGVTHVQNCANIDWNGLPGDPNPHNEFDCAEIANLPPWHPAARPKVLIQKSAAPTCWRAAPGASWKCFYQVNIKNSGTAPLMGPIIFTDKLALHPAALTNLSGAPGGWGCVPGIGNFGPFTCKLPAIGGGLVPGQSVTLAMEFKIPPGIVPPSAEQNCATTKWDNDGDGVDEVHTSCAVALICDAGEANCPKDMAVLKLPPFGPCLKGSQCQFTVIVKNLGDADYPGPVVIKDIPTLNTGQPDVITPGWTCQPAGGSYSCKNPAGILAGGSATFSLKFPIPPGYPSPIFKNCARIAPGPLNTLAFNDQSCKKAVVPFADLAVWSPSSCDLGTDCTLDVQIDNKGLLPFVGSAGMRGTLSPAVQIKSIKGQTPGLYCNVTGNGAYQCQGQSLNIAPGEAAKLQLIVAIPANFPHKKITHTKTIFWPDLEVKDPNPENDTHVSTIDIKQPEKPRPVAHNCPKGWTKVPPSGAPLGWKVLAIDGINPDGTKWGLMCMKPPPPPPPPTPPAGRPDLAITKTPNQGVCVAGGPCSYRVTATNVGTAPFIGKIKLSDIISPAGAQLTASGPAPWRCRKAGRSYSCTHPRTRLNPGQSKTLSLTFRLARSATGAARNCAALVWGRTTLRSSIREVQSALKARGFNPGPADGKAGRKTIEAIREYQRQQSLQPTGRIDQALLSSLFGGGGDSNPANDRACAVSSILVAPPPPPPQCTGERFRNSSGICVCPSSKPLWTGQDCIPARVLCAGGQFFDTKQNKCVCPSDKPVWNNQNKTCTARPVVCTGGRTPSYVRGKIRCTCPSNKPVWNNQNKACTARPVVCTGGRTPSYAGGKIRCTCPSNTPVWDNQNKTCTARPVVCTGGRTPSYAGGKIRCTCPSNKPVWDNKNKTCRPRVIYPLPGGPTTIPGGPSQIGCSGGRSPSASGQCVCPKFLPYWNGSKCTKGGPPVTRCYGGQYFNKNKNRCLCPSSKPNWIGNKCLKLQFLPGQQLQKPYQPQYQQQKPQMTPQQQQQQNINKLLKQYSDARLKRDITHLATLESGIRLYSFRYLWEDTLRVGVMAQDLLGHAATRGAVTMTPSGFYTVNYRMLGLKMTTLEAWRTRGRASVLEHDPFILTHLMVQISPLD